MHSSSETAIACSRIIFTKYLILALKTVLKGKSGSFMRFSLFCKIMSKNIPCMLCYFLKSADVNTGKVFSLFHDENSFYLNNMKKMTKFEDCTALLVIKKIENLKINKWKIFMK